MNYQLKHKIIGLLIIIPFLTSCRYVDEYYATNLKKPEILIGYKTVNLKEDIEPVVEIVFENNSAELSDEHIELIGTVLATKTYYIVEATAGGYSSGSKKIADKRVANMISVLESFGIKSDSIYVAQYAGYKQGRRGYLYAVSY